MNESEPVFIETPIGPITLRHQTSPFRLVSVALPGSGKQAARYGAGGGRDEVQTIIRMIRDYFYRMPITPPWHLLAMDHLTGLQRKVLYETARIPYGELKTYQAVAEAIGHPRAYRFVGSALGKNPFPIIIPCHRVVRHDGSVGGFGAGPDIKRWLIDFEAGRRSFS